VYDDDDCDDRAIVVVYLTVDDCPVNDAARPVTSGQSLTNGGQCANETEQNSAASALCSAHCDGVGRMRLQRQLLNVTSACQ